MALTLAALLAPLGGCFSYRPVEAPGPTPGERVRVELTGAGQDALMTRRALAMERLSGLVVGRDADAVMLQVTLDPARLGYGSRAVTDTLTIPRGEIRDIGVRSLDGTRTLAAAALGVIGVAGIYALFEAALNSGEGSGEPTDVLFLRVPLGSR